MGIEQESIAKDYIPNHIQKNQFLNMFVYKWEKIMSDTWNAKIYGKFLGLRTRPARDLLSAFPPDFQPEIVYDKLFMVGRV